MMTKANRNGIARALRVAAKSVANGVMPDGVLAADAVESGDLP